MFISNFLYPCHTGFCLTMYWCCRSISQKQNDRLMFSFQVALIRGYNIISVEATSGCNSTREIGVMQATFWPFPSENAIIEKHWISIEYSVWLVPLLYYPDRKLCISRQIFHFISKYIPYQLPYRSSMNENIAWDYSKQADKLQLIPQMQYPWVTLCVLVK